MVKQTVIMAILDGWGIGRNDPSNPIRTTNPPTIGHIKRAYTIGSLQASGIAVGLPWEEESNSQVGHLMLGAGKVLYQHFPRISLAIKNGDFYKNETLRQAFMKATEKNARVHFAGLVSGEQVHASLDHLVALFKMADQCSFSREKIFLHMFVDERESDLAAIRTLLDTLTSEVGTISIASASGSYFAMDSDKRWDRTVKAYEALTTEALTELPSLDTLLALFHNRNLAFEFVRPTLLLKEGVVRANDSIIFFNFREASMRQLVQLFLDPAFANVGNPLEMTHLEKKENLYIATFTEYSRSFPVAVAFPPESIKEPLGKALADAGKIQLRIAETERYPHVTFFFNGLRQEPFTNEYRVLIPSRNIPDQRAYPEMMAAAITTRAMTAIHERAYDFILINYANADAMARTGDYDAVVKAITTIDGEVKKLMEATLATDNVLIITSGHGNAERVMNPYTGVPEMKNDPNPVPFYIVGKGFERPKQDEEVESLEHENIGVLSDVAPTILALLGVPKPNEMTGIDILSLL